LEILRDALARAEGKIDSLIAERNAALKALRTADSILWMAERYADSGGSNGPEMRDYKEVQAQVDAVLKGVNHESHKEG
jgi:hypothetical protein